tara:strand:+ start:68 stop:358 length:291 start_codon:yes stop_codon:yes gene_type:complete
MKIDRNVISGQCQGAWLRVQIKTNAYFLGEDRLPKFFRQGFNVGFFAPSVADGSINRNFWFSLPSPHGGQRRWPRWFAIVWRLFSFRFDLYRNREA